MLRRRVELCVARLWRYWKRSATRVRHAHLIPYLALVSGILWTLYWLLHTPVPGKAVALLGVVAMFITFRGESRPAERVLWILVVLALFIVESMAINKDRAQYDATMRGIASLAEDSLRNITGGDSVPYIIPQTHAGVDPLPLIIGNRGKYQLSGVTVIIRNGNDLGATFFNRPELSVGMVHPGFPRLLATGISPHPDRGGVDTYLIEMSTQSALFTEVLQFRKGRYSLPWAYRYRVEKQNLTQTPTGSVTNPVIVLSQTEWSDDLGDGKPTK